MSATGVTKCEQVLVNAGAADWELPADTLGAIDGIVAEELGMLAQPASPVQGVELKATNGRTQG